MTRRSSKPLPSQLQLSYATVNAPGLLDYPRKDTNLLNNKRQENGVIVEPSLAIDAVVVEPTPRRDNEKLAIGKQRSSDTTESSNSAAGDWASQATSATMSKMPLSPSTQGTSIMSQDSVEKNNAAGQTPTGTSPSNKNIEAPSVEMGMGTTTDALLEGKGLIMETVRNLKKKPSRFRMNGLNFWKKSKSASPPMPVGAAREWNRLGPGSEEGGQ
jgi:3',5'-cyclic-nucleotide phosphodiesterase